MNVVFCSSEVFPLAKTGGLADVIGALPVALEKLGVEVSIFLPWHKTIDLKNYQVEKINDQCSRITLGDHISVYLLANNKFFGRPGIYGDSSGDYPDNLERFQFFCLKTLEFLKENNIKADIIHCHDWQTALIPVYLKEKFKGDDFYSKMKTVLTIHNLAYQGLFPKSEFSKLGFKKELFGLDGFEFYGQVNFLKGGIIYSDMVTTVSKQYAKDIRNKEYGCGLEEVLRARKKDVLGIINGLDYDIWDSTKDYLISRTYSSDNFIEGKRENKKQLQQRLNLAINAEIPLFGFIGRLSHQKGIDLILETVKKLNFSDMQLVIQGVGEDKYQRQLLQLKDHHPEHIAVCLDFDEKLAHNIYAASDLFLMPSLYEPCGLSQMISLRYGTIPIVYKTGGLADTIIAHDSKEGKGNGFVFDKYKADAFLKTIQKAKEIYSNKEQFYQLIHNGYHADFRWDKSALEYQNLYQCLLSG